MNRSFLFDIISIADSWQADREFLRTLFDVFGYSLEHDELGNYDKGTDGYLVFKHPEDDFWIKVFLTEDSYSGGYYSYHAQVQPTTKTITAYEPVTKTVRDWK